MVFEPHSEAELSADLEWMLQSGQADLLTLAETLVQHSYAQVYRLCLACLQDERAALNATLDTFGAALAGLHTYRSSDGIDAWIYGSALRTCRSMRRAQAARRLVGSSRAIQPGTGETEPLTAPERADSYIWRALDDLSEPVRLALIVDALLELPPAAATRLLDLTDHRLRTLLEQGYAACRTALPAGGDPPDPSDPDIRLQIAESLRRRWPAPDLEPGHLEQVTQTSLLAAETTRLQRRISIPMKEFLFLVPLVILVVGMIWGVDQLLPGVEPTPIPLAATPRVVVIVTTSTPDRPAPMLTPYQTPTTTRPLYPPYPDEAYYVIQAGDTLSLLGRELGFTVEDFRQLNRLPSGSQLQPGQRLLVPRMIPPGRPEIFSVQANPTPSAPLTDNSTPQEIRDRLENQTGNWSSIWMDALIQYHDLDGAIGADQGYRLQLWMHPDYALVLAGPAGSDPAEVVLSMPDNLLVARPGQGMNWFTPISDLTELHNLIRLEYLLFAIPPWRVPAPNHQEVTVNRRIEIAGRQALVIEQHDETGPGKTRFCLDIWTGVLLCQQRFANATDGLPYLDISVQSIAYDIQLPSDLLDPYLPWRGGYARDYTGSPIPRNVPDLNWTPAPTPRPRAYHPVPPGMDTGMARLTFAYSAPLNIFEPTQADSRVQIFLYAGKYFLGAPRFFNPIFLTCQRSADGRLIAYTNSGLDRGMTADSILRWFSLDSPEIQIEPSQAIEAVEFAIAPQSDIVALLGYAPDGDHGLFLVNTDSGSAGRLLEIEHARSILWDPDGETLALLGRKNRWDGGGEDLLIVSSTNGAIVFQQALEEVDPASGKLPEWLVQAWGTKFPHEMGGLEDCIQPPAP